MRRQTGFRQERDRIDVSGIEHFHFRTRILCNQRFGQSLQVFGPIVLKARAEIEASTAACDDLRARRWHSQTLAMGGSSAVITRGEVDHGVAAGRTY
jgi:hypothetical protein